jgi:O-methyltransferase involved in polyketide biosynthesis
MTTNEMKIKIELGEVQKTLLMPLWGRAKEYEKQNPIIMDKYAFDIISKLDHDFERMSRSFDEYLQKYWATRAYNIDCAIFRVLDDFPDATIINVGAGLDTTFQRVDNGKIFWYDLDLPDTITLRKELIPETERNHYISKSVFDKSWFAEVKNIRSKVFIIASGVLCYFEKNSIRDLFLELIDEFPEGEMIFELMSKILIWLSNREVVHNKEKLELSVLRWGAHSSKSIKKWSSKIQVIDEYPIFSRINIDKSWNKHTITRINQMNSFKWTKMIQLKFNK